MKYQWDRIKDVSSHLLCNAAFEITERLWCMQVELWEMEGEMRKRMGMTADEQRRGMFASVDEIKIRDRLTAFCDRSVSNGNYIMWSCYYMDHKSLEMRDTNSKKNNPTILQSSLASIIYFDLMP